MTKVCSFCDAVITNESESVCNACMKKYGMDTFDNSRDGCGCDCWQGGQIIERDILKKKNIANTKKILPKHSTTNLI